MLEWQRGRFDGGVGRSALQGVPQRAVMAIHINDETAGVRHAQCSELIGSIGVVAIPQTMHAPRPSEIDAELMLRPFPRGNGGDDLAIFRIAAPHFFCVVPKCFDAAIAGGTQTHIGDGIGHVASFVEEELSNGRAMIAWCWRVHQSPLLARDAQK